jgi:hypothetical protein
MTLEATRTRTPDPAGRVVAWAATIGGVAFAAGFFGPLLLSSSNLGPLLGIFVTGPLGALLGLWVGAMRVAKDATRLAIALLGAVWVLTLLYTLWALFYPTMAALAVPLQVLVIGSSIHLLAARETRARLPDDLRRSGLIVIAAQAAILVMTLFPPAMRPWWGQLNTLPAQHATAPLPAFAFILDGRFAADMHVPALAVNRPELALEWTIAIAVALGLDILMRALRPRRAG